MKRRCVAIFILLAGIFLISVTNVYAQSRLPIVRAVLFYSPACGHCQYVISETLVPLMTKYGEQLQIVGLDVTQEYGQVLFLNALQKFNLNQGGVPFLVVDNMYLVGSVDIPEIFPGLVETYLMRGDVDWPDIPGLREIISQTSPTERPTVAAPTHPASLQTTSVPTAASPTSISSIIAVPGPMQANTHNATWVNNLARDPTGNALAVIVLVGMLGSVVWVAIFFRMAKGVSLKNDRTTLLVPILCVVGLCVAGYLAYVEIFQTTAVCGPVGDCNTVQQSEYARLFGVLPIGILGFIGYAAIFVSWLTAQYANGWLAGFAIVSFFAMTIIGTLFSIYLTFLEPFVIGATCAWCLTSAILMTLLMLLMAGAAKKTFMGILEQYRS